MDVETTLPPERVREMLIDFSERRPEIWPGIAASLYEVRERGDTWADVREGTKAPGLEIWAVEHYDWSLPGTVTWTVKESNFSTVGSSVTAELRARDGGGTVVHVTWIREGNTVKGKLAMRLIKLLRGKPVAQSMRRGFEREERRGQPG
jgi:hypothetical protein